MASESQFLKVMNKAGALTSISHSRSFESYVFRRYSVRLRAWIMHVACAAATLVLVGYSARLNGGWNSSWVGGECFTDHLANTDRDNNKGH